MKPVKSYISGCDDILDEGLNRPSIVLVAGVAGTGKTTFTMQSIYNAAKEGEICMYITAISEPIAMIHIFMSKFNFYDINLMAKGNIKYVPLEAQVIKNGTSAIFEEIERNIHTIKPDRIIIDPINALTTWMDETEKREFYYDLFIKMKGWNSLVLITAELSYDTIWKDQISYLADGIICLSHERVREKRVRYLEVLKMRGVDYSTGKHSFKITNEGLVVFPTLHPDKPRPFSSERLTTGIKGLDKMTNGGLIKDSNTLISGGSGTGKTLIGLQFLVAGASLGEPGVFVSFKEDPQILKKHAAAFGWDIDKFEQEGLIKILCISAYQSDINEMVQMIKRLNKTIGSKRIVIDDINGFKSILPHDSLITEYIYYSSKYFASSNITSIFINDVPEFMGSSTNSGNENFFFMDSIILLRYVEIRSKIKKAISVLKIRGSDHDKEIRELDITDKGIKVKKPFVDYSGLMSGNPVKAFENVFGSKE
jgi:circadian clock protein KaiC